MPVPLIPLAIAAARIAPTAAEQVPTATRALTKWLSRREAKSQLTDGMRGVLDDSDSSGLAASTVYNDNQLDNMWTRSQNTPIEGKSLLSYAKKDVPEDVLAQHYLKTARADGSIPVTEQTRMLAKQLGMTDKLMERGSGRDYDLNMFVQKGSPESMENILRSPRDAHFSDIGKLQSHPTLSKESAYATAKNPGGEWNRTGPADTPWVYTMSPAQVNNQEGLAKTFAYLGHGNTHGTHPDDKALVRLPHIPLLAKPME